MTSVSERTAGAFGKACTGQGRSNCSDRSRTCLHSHYAAVVRLSSVMLCICWPRRRGDGLQRWWLCKCTASLQKAVLQRWGVSETVLFILIRKFDQWGFLIRVFSLLICKAEGVFLKYFFYYTQSKRCLKHLLLGKDVWNWRHLSHCGTFKNDSNGS